MKDSCFANQGIHYWFYLAFENSNCPDYITEKLWRILDLPVVPIVMGGGNYRRDAPPHSVIDVNDFPHVKGLASYLNFLMENPVRFRFTTRSYYKVHKLPETVSILLQKEYLKYFAWKKEYMLYEQDPYCILCQKLHDPDEPAKIYPSMMDWYYRNPVDGDLLCKDGSERSYFSSIFE